MERARRDGAGRCCGLRRVTRAEGALVAASFCSGIKASRHDHMRELRIQHAGKPYRVLYAFDPRRVALLLIGGDKTGNARWYEEFVPIADRLYDEHLVTLGSEEQDNG